MVTTAPCNNRGKLSQIRLQLKLMFLPSLFQCALPSSVRLITASDHRWQLTMYNNSLICINNYSCIIIQCQCSFSIKFVNYSFAAECAYFNSILVPVLLIQDALTPVLLIQVALTPYLLIQAVHMPSPCAVRHAPSLLR